MMQSGEASSLPDLSGMLPTDPTIKPRALVVVGDGSEEMEVLTLSDLLALGGMHVTLAALGRKPANVVEGSFGLRIKADQSIEDASFATFDVIVLPGGAAAERYLECELLKKMLETHARDGGWLTASANAPVRVLRPLGLLDTALTARLMTDCYVDAGVVTSGRCVTSQGPGTAIALGLTLIELLVDKQEARAVAREICYDWE